MSPIPGLRFDLRETVTDADTAIAYGTGSVPVLATPRVIAWCETAALSAVASALRADETTVSCRVEISHIAPVAVGQTVSVDAVLERVEGRRLVFAVSVTDPRGLVAAGRVTRIVVETERFMKKVT